MKTSKRPIFFAIGIAFIAIAAGLVMWYGPYAPESDRGELRKLRVGHLIALDMAPHFVAKEAGYFEEMGLDVELSSFGPYQNDKDLAAGKLDISITPFTLPYIALQKGVPIRVVASAGGWGVMQVVIQGNYNVNNMEELAQYVKSHPGKKLRVGTLRGDTIDLILLDAFRKVGLSYDDVEMVFIDNIFKLVDAFKEKEIVILSHIKPYTTDLIKNYGAKFLSDNAMTWNVNTPNCVIAVLENLVVNEPQTIEAYLMAVKKGAALINENPEKAVALLKDAAYPNYFKVGYDVVLEGFKSQPAPITFTPNIAAVNAVMFNMHQEKYIDKYIPGRKVFRLNIIKNLESI